MDKKFLLDLYGCAWEPYKSRAIDFENIIESLSAIKMMNEAQLKKFFIQICDEKIKELGGETEFVYHQHTTKGKIGTTIKPAIFKKILLLGRDENFLHMFSCESDAKIHVYGGHLNSGYFKRN